MDDNAAPKPATPPKAPRRKKKALDVSNIPVPRQVTVTDRLIGFVWQNACIFLMFCSVYWPSVWAKGLKESNYPLYLLMRVFCTLSPVYCPLWLGDFGARVVFSHVPWMNGEE